MRWAGTLFFLAVTSFASDNCGSGPSGFGEFAPLPDKFLNLARKLRGRPLLESEVTALAESERLKTETGKGRRKEDGSIELISPLEIYAQRRKLLSEAGFREPEALAQLLKIDSLPRHRFPQGVSDEAVVAYAVEFFEALTRGGGPEAVFVSGTPTDVESFQNLFRRLESVRDPSLLAQLARAPMAKALQAHLAPTGKIPSKRLDATSQIIRRFARSSAIMGADRSYINARNWIEEYRLGTAYWDGKSSIAPPPAHLAPLAERWSSPARALAETPLITLLKRDPKHMEERTPGRVSLPELVRYCLDPAIYKNPARAESELRARLTAEGYTKLSELQEQALSVEENFLTSYRNLRLYDREFRQYGRPKMRDTSVNVGLKLLHEASPQPSTKGTSRLLFQEITTAVIEHPRIDIKAEYLRTLASRKAWLDADPQNLEVFESFLTQLNQASAKKPLALRHNLPRSPEVLQFFREVLRKPGTDALGREVARYLELARVPASP